jgi:hypothetical protein
MSCTVVRREPPKTKEPIDRIELESEYAKPLRAAQSTANRGCVELKNSHYSPWPANADRLYSLDSFEEFCRAGLELVEQIRSGR